MHSPNGLWHLSSNKGLQISKLESEINNKIKELNINIANDRPYGSTLEEISVLEDALTFLKQNYKPNQDSIDHYGLGTPLQG